MPISKSLLIKLPQSRFWKFFSRFQLYQTYPCLNVCPGRPSCWLNFGVLQLIRSERYYFGIRIQKIVLYCLYRSKTNYIRLSNGLLFIFVAVFINCTSSWQHHYHGHICFKFRKNLTSHKIFSHVNLCQYILTNAKWA